MLLRCAWWSLSLGWFLNLSLQRMNVMTFLTWTLDLSVLDTPPGSWLWHLRQWLCLCCLVSLFPVMLLPSYCNCTSRHSGDCLESCYVSVQVTYLLDMLFLKENEYQYTYLNTCIVPRSCPTSFVLSGMTRKGCVLVGPPRKGVSNGSVGSWLTGERVLMGDGK